MMTIDIKINGRLVDRLAVRNIGPDPRTPEEADRCGGERLYRVSVPFEGPTPIGGVRHMRSDGPRELARRALDAMT